MFRGSPFLYPPASERKILFILRRARQKLNHDFPPGSSRYLANLSYLSVTFRFQLLIFIIGFYVLLTLLPIFHFDSYIVLLGKLQGLINENTEFFKTNFDILRRCFLIMFDSGEGKVWKTSIKFRLGSKRLRFWFPRKARANVPHLTFFTGKFILSEWDFHPGSSSGTRRTRQDFGTLWPIRNLARNKNIYFSSSILVHFSIQYFSTVFFFHHNYLFRHSLSFCLCLLTFQSGLIYRTQTPRLKLFDGKLASFARFAFRPGNFSTEANVLAGGFK